MDIKQDNPSPKICACRFCSADSHVRIVEALHWSVKCELCGAWGPRAGTPRLAVEMWNDGHPVQVSWDNDWQWRPFALGRMVPPPVLVLDRAGRVFRWDDLSALKANYGGFEGLFWMQMPPAPIPPKKESISRHPFDEWADRHALTEANPAAARRGWDAAIAALQNEDERVRPHR